MKSSCAFSRLSELSPACIGDCPDAVIRQFFDQRLRTVTAHAVDDTALPVMPVDEGTIAAIFSFLLSPRRIVSDRFGRSKDEMNVLGSRSFN